MTAEVDAGTVGAVEGLNERTLVVMRHARAESFAADDRVRELTLEGIRDARAAGLWAATQGLRFDAALVSTAVRTRQTWDAFAAAAGCTAIEPCFDEAIYSAGTDSALECLRTLPEDARTAVFLGHNPTVGMLAQVLEDGRGDSALHSRLGSGFPPASIAVLTFDCAWEAVDFGTGRLVDVRVVHH